MRNDLAGLRVQSASGNRTGMDIQADACTLEHSWNLQFQMWLYLSAKSGRQPTSRFEKEVPARKTRLPHIV